MRTLYFLISVLVFTVISCHSPKRETEKFPPEMVSFKPYENNPVFSGTKSDTWDDKIRERGYILHEEGIFKMWYSGYNGGSEDPKYLGYATSTDGINWSRHSNNPVFDAKWTEDMFVIKDDGTYYMFAEGENDVAHFLTSPDGINWTEQGDLTIITTRGDTLSAPYGTPVIWIENGQWYLFYERNDDAIWLAKSDDKLTWTNVQDEPVLRPGPDEYDFGAVAANQIIKYKDRYYMYYHGNAIPLGVKTEKRSIWTSNVAVSEDLINWEKYPGNPIVEGDHSSPILVYYRDQYLLYTMHDIVWLYFPWKTE